MSVSCLVPSLLLSLAVTNPSHERFLNEGIPSNFCSEDVFTSKLNPGDERFV